VLCGLQIPASKDRLRWFKLALDPTAVQDSELGYKYPDFAAARTMSKEGAKQATIEYMSFMRKHFDRMLALSHLSTIAKEIPKSFVLTVPACWSSAAKDLTRSCAKAAGFGDDVVTVSEPEAAVLHSLSVVLPTQLKVGDKFIVIDAGGGTIDLISYVIQAIDGGIKIDEVVRGAGRVAGGTFVDKEFCQVINDRFSELPKWSPKKLEAARHYFETHSKVTFNGEEDEYGEKILVPVPGLDDCEDLRFEDGYAYFTVQEIEDVFSLVMKEIFATLSSQLNALSGKPRAILLVGGFGQSPYLMNQVQKRVGKDVDVMQPAHAQTAVVRGAVIKGVSDFDPRLNKITIGSRIARKNYGLAIHTRYAPDVHEKKRM
jgi:hypothetical protein